MWKQNKVKLQDLNELSKNNLRETLQINFTEIGDWYLRASMPVSEVTATARPLHIGVTLHVWDIRVEDESQHLIAASRLTVAIINIKKGGVTHLE